MLVWKKQDKDFGDQNYCMEDYYQADTLVIGNLCRISNRMDDAGILKLVTIKQKYIFRVIQDHDQLKYQEIFTGFIAESELEYFNLPCVVNIVSMVDYFPKLKGSNIPKLSLLWLLNDINYSIQKCNSKKLKRCKKQINYFKFLCKLLVYFLDCNYYGKRQKI